MPSPSASVAGDAATAASLVDSYERSLVDGQWRAAWDMLSGTDQTRRGTLTAYTSERSAFYKSVAGTYTVATPTHDAAALAPWTSSPDVIKGADLARAYIVQADYPNIGGNAGYDVFLVAPGATGAWRIWEVR